MIFQQPDESPYDLRFSFFGFQTRIAWTFWLVAVILGYDLTRIIDIRFGAESPGVLPLLMIWTACIMVSILIHELGHAIAFRWYGIDASILLFHLGGLAIPTGVRMGGRSFARLRPIDELIVAAAGPAFQIGSALVLSLVVWFYGYQVTAFFLMPGPLSDIGRTMGGMPLPGAALFALVNFYVLPSIMWALLNLLPVLPLDGGRIAQSVIVLSGGDVVQARWLGVIASVVISVYAFQSGHTFLGIFFIWMGITNYQAITSGGHWA